MARPHSEAIHLFFNKHRRVTPWGVRYRGIDKKTGKRRRFSPYFATEKEALDLKTDIEKELRQLAAAPVSTVPMRGQSTFQTYGRYFLGQLDAVRTASTIDGYRRILEKHVFPHIGHDILSPETFGTDTIARLMAILVKRQMPYPQQVMVLKVVGSCLDWAKTDKFLTENPVPEVVEKRSTPSEYRKPEPNPLTAEQARAFLHWIEFDEVPANYQPAGRRRGQKPRQSLAESSRWWSRRPTKKKGERGRQPNRPFWLDYFTLLFLTGVRRNEGTALMWDHVFVDDDGHPPAIEIAWTFSATARTAALAGDKRYRKDGLTLPKGKKVRTFEPLPRPLVEMLRRRWRTRQERAGFGKDPSPFVFTTTEGRQIQGGLTVDRIFGLGMAAIGAADEGHTVHDIRDTFATLHLMADPKQLLRISHLLGHSNVRITQERYMKWIHQQHRDHEFTTALDGLLSATKREDQTGTGER